MVAKTPDEIQYHILGVIRMMMQSYCLTLEQVKEHMDFVNMVPPEYIVCNYDEFIDKCQDWDYAKMRSDHQSPSSSVEPMDNEIEMEDVCSLSDTNDSARSVDTYDSLHSTESYEDCEMYEGESGGEETSSENYNSEKNKIIYVKTRREFCSVMSKGIKICPRYSSCEDEHCKNFHIKNQHLCPHNPKSSYCDHDDCELIVIKPCRRGNHCKDPNCSFRHT